MAVVAVSDAVCGVAQRGASACCLAGSAEGYAAASCATRPVLPSSQSQHRSTAYLQDDQSRGILWPDDVAWQVVSEGDLLHGCACRDEETCETWDLWTLGLCDQRLVVHQRVLCSNACACVLKLWSTHRGVIQWAEQRAWKTQGS